MASHSVRSLGALASVDDRSTWAEPESLVSSPPDQVQGRCQAEQRGLWDVSSVDEREGGGGVVGQDAHR